MVNMSCIWECVEECIKRRLPFNDIFLEFKVREMCIEECRRVLEEGEDWVSYV